MLGGEVVGTKAPTGHTLLIACRFELPFGKFVATIFSHLFCSTPNRKIVEIKLYEVRYL